MSLTLYIASVRAYRSVNGTAAKRSRHAYVGRTFHGSSERQPVEAVQELCGRES